MLNEPMPKRVLHVFMNLNLGGAESRIMDLFRTQNKDVLVNDFVIMTKEHCYFTDEVLGRGGEIHVIDSPREGLLKNLWQLYRLLRKKPKYTAIHAHTSYYSGLCVFIAFLAGISARIPHARNTSTGVNNLSTRVMLSLGRALCAIFATHRFAISKAAGQFLYGSASNGTVANFDVIPNAFDFHSIRHRQSITQEDKINYQLDPQVLNIVCVGRFYAVKNHRFLLDTVRCLANRRSNFCLHLIGDGELHTALQEQVQRLGLAGKVRFWGKRSDVAQLLALFDVMVMTSNSEGLGVAALEAQAAGLPCVLSTGIPDEADIGVGLCQFLALNEGHEVWSDAIEQQSLVDSVNKVDIDLQFEQRGYCLSTTRQRYLDAYLHHEKN